MEQNFTATGMLKNKCVKYACTTKELSYIIGNVFAELSPPCNKCNGENKEKHPDTTAETCKSYKISKK